MSEKILKAENTQKSRQNIELLAPAQNKECAFSAIDCGADSIYIGANLFGARKNACNSLEDIEEIINYAHKFSVKVYVTINTILDNNELLQAIELIHKLHKIKTDGIIFQDFGILEAAYKGKLPDIKLIASTQCDNREKDKVKFFENIGVGRVILARELSLEKIREICKDTKIEIETFVHGALCVSYSGQCYLSCKIGGRSANKGECAQACRKKYSLIDENGKIIAKDKYLLSLKDFMAADKLEELIDAGATSFKIEGRLKDANYIKNTVIYYRQALDKILAKKKLKKSSSGKVFLGNENTAGDLSENIADAAFKANPKKSFNRDFCEYFLSGKRENIWNFDTPNSKGEFLGEVKTVGKNYFTISLVQKEVEIHPQDGLCFFEPGNKNSKESGVLKGLLVNSYKDGKIYPNVMPEIQIGTEIFKNKDALFETTLKNLKPKRRIYVDFKVFSGYIEAQDENGQKVRVEFSTNELAKNKEIQKKAWIEAFCKTGNSDFYTQKIEFLSDEIYFLRKSELNELRRKALEELTEQRLKNYKPQKQGKIAPVQFPEKQGDYRLNVHNDAAKEFYEKCGCKVLETSFESGRKALCNTLGAKANKDIVEENKKQSTGKQKAELMRTKHCIRYALNMCLKNREKHNITNRDAKKDVKIQEIFLQDEKGQKYRLQFDCRKCEMAILEY